MAKKILFGLFLFTLFACSRDPGKPGFEIKWLWTDMMYAVPYEAYSENPVLANGQTLQQPVEGTVHRDAVIEIPEQIPFAVNEKVLSEGKRLYAHFCLHCHGPQGFGDGPVSKKFMKPPSYQDERVLMLSARALYDVMSLGKGAMPSHAGQVDPLERWMIAAYIKEELQKHD